MQLSPLILSLREKLEPKLIYSPFLRLIIFSPLFLLGFLAFLFTLIAGGLYLPKIWRVSPDGFEPIVRISGLDMTQNWSLKRSARQLEAAGKIPEAIEAWQGAVAQNPADLAALRGALNSCTKLQRREERVFYSALSQMQWLLRINNTNSTDVDLIARTCDRFAIYDFAAYLLELVDKEKLPPSAKAVLLKNNFHQGRITDFADALEKGRGVLNDPELKYYELAYSAGWKSDPESPGAFAELVQAVENPELSERVGHLLLRAAAQRGKADLYAQILDRMARRNEARADDHALYWSVLAATGKTNEAVKLAEAATVKPSTASEIIRVAQSYLALGMLDQAGELMKEMAPRYSRTPELWMLYVDVLAARKDWDGMRNVARMIRGDVGTRETLWGYSYYLDGRADYEQKRQASARESFDQAVNSSYEYPPMGAFVGRELTRLGSPEKALKLYPHLEPALKENLAFWDAYSIAAVAALDGEALLKATEAAHNLVPKDMARLNNYAAALLVNQVRPDEAIQLTLQLYSRYPESNAALINHSCALLLNQRASEARALLEKVNAGTLGSGELSQYYFTMFELYHSLQMWPEAERMRSRVTESTLFPVQRNRLHEKSKQLPSLARAA